jgi:hypothetical protein
MTFEPAPLTCGGKVMGRYRVSIEADKEGITAVWLDLTSDEVAVLARVASRLTEASNHQRRLTVSAETPMTGTRSEVAREAMSFGTGHGL